MHPRVAFSMRVLESPRGTVSGQIQDEDPLGFPELGTVAGKAHAFSLTLEIERPLFRLPYANRLITLEEWVRERYPAVQEVNTVPHPTIYLAARLFRLPGFMAGPWWVPSGTVVDEISGWRATYPDQSGVWQAHRHRDAR